MSNHFSTPQRQSIFALGIIFFRVLKNIVTVVWPLVLTIAFGKEEKRELKWMIFLAGITAIVLIKTLLDYLFFRFYFQDGDLVVKKGLFKKEQVTIPLSRIQAVHLEQSLLHTLTGTYKVSMDTAGTEKEEVAIYALNSRDALLLRELVLQEDKDAPITKNRYNELNGELVSTLSFRGFLRFSLSTNHLETLLVMLAFVIGRFQDIRPLMGKVQFLKDMEAYSGSVVVTWQMAFITLLVAFVLAVMISIVRTALRYYGYTIRKNRRGFYLEWGLVQVKQKMIPFRKIQMVSWKNSLLRRLMGLWLLNLRATGENDLKKKFKILIPITTPTQIEAIGGHYQPHFPAHAGVPAMRISRGYAFRRVLFLTLPFVLVLGTALFFKVGWHALWLLLLLPYSYISSMVFVRNFRCWVTEHGLQYYKGVWGREEALVNWDKVQYASLNQNIYQRRKGLADLVLQTAGGNFTLPYIRLDEARALMNYASYRVSSSQRSWL